MTAKKKAKSEMVGEGCLLQGVALLLPVAGGAFAGTIGLAGGLVGGIVLFISGSAKSKKWICGNCGNPIANKDVMMCPTCRSRFTN